jgi:hypothetical protein
MPSARPTSSARDGAKDGNPGRIDEIELVLPCRISEPTSTRICAIGTEYYFNILRLAAARSSQLDRGRPEAGANRTGSPR